MQDNHVITTDVKTQQFSTSGSPDCSEGGPGAERLGTHITENSRAQRAAAQAGTSQSTDTSAS